MNRIALLLLLASASSFAADGAVPGSELSVAGIEIGQTPAQVAKTLGAPKRKVEIGDSLEYHYSRVRVSISENMVIGLFSDDPRGCTPAGLCPGDGLDKMRATYGQPLVANRETGMFYEYYATDATCWLQMSAKGDLIASIAVACQP